MYTSKIEKYLIEKYNTESDSGRFGKAFECALRETLSHRGNQVVRGQGKADYTISYMIDGKRKRFTMEIKTACGEIETAHKSQYIVYCPDVQITEEAETQCFVFTREEWLDFVNGYTGRGKFLRADKRGHLHIQSFYTETRPKASKPIANYIWDSCLDRPTMEEFLEMIGRA